MLACLTWVAMPTLAQSGRGTITGTVTDSSGAIVPNADITITNKANGEETKAKTTTPKLFRAPYLEPGTYSVAASVKGFKTATRDNVQVLLAQTVTLDFTLELGEVTENVTVSFESPLLEASQRPRLEQMRRSATSTLGRPSFRRNSGTAGLYLDTMPEPAGTDFKGLSMVVRHTAMKS